jgi:hypothetical protein
VSEGGREGVREGVREGRREGGKEGGREGAREKGLEGIHRHPEVKGSDPAALNTFYMKRTNSRDRKRCCRM